MSKQSFPLSKVYRLLEPGPVVMITTANKGKSNIMTMSWLTMLEFEPPLVAALSATGTTVRYPDGKQGVRDQHSDGGTGKTSGWRREQFRKKSRQVQ
jgi:hypothetical protein